MPPSKRSGTAHSSKAKHVSSSSNVDRQEAGPSSSSRSSRIRPVVEDDGEEAEEDDDGREEEMAGRTGAERVEQLLAQFDREPRALTMDVSDGKLKTLRSDWATMESNFEIAFQLITQAGERLADSLAADGIVDEDEVRLIHQYVTLHR